jgi:NAD(P)-dependent dehydrogenase (short-subunit alcohol dehydrogenase family)
MPDSPGRLAGKIAVITGGASGIGLAAARRFVADGASVVIGDRNQRALDVAQSDLGDAVSTVCGDVTVEADVESLVAAAVERHGRLDIAYANAGIGSAGRIVDLPVDEWSNVVDICLKGAFLTIKHAARAMSEGGSIGSTPSPPAWFARVSPTPCGSCPRWSRTTRPTRRSAGTPSPTRSPTSWPSWPPTRLASCQGRST